jgi:hypothetical protein
MSELREKRKESRESKEGIDIVRTLFSVFCYSFKKNNSSLILTSQKHKIFFFIHRV